MKSVQHGWKMRGNQQKTLFHFISRTLRPKTFKKHRTFFPIYRGREAECEEREMRNEGTVRDLNEKSGLESSLTFPGSLNSPFLVARGPFLAFGGCQCQGGPSRRFGRKV
jgi:hypothetical protein